MEHVLKFFSDHSGAVQAFSSVLSAVLTFVYVRLTSSLVNVPYKAFLRPKKINWKDSYSSFGIVLINYGPGLSSMIKVTAYATIQMQKESNQSDTWLYKTMIIAQGPDEMKVYEERSFLVNGYFSQGCYLVIEYDSLTGKKYKTKWKCNGYKQEEIKPFNILNDIEFFLKILLGFARKPYIAFKKWKYCEYRFTSKMLLIKLNIVGSLSYHELAEYSIKETEQVWKILEELFKHGYVSHPDNSPFDYRITEKGYTSLKGDERVGKAYYDGNTNHIKYDGIFKDGEFHGIGTFYYLFMKKLYSGEWYEGKKSGKGISYSKDSGQVIYEGEWKNDLMHGFGRLYDLDGNLIYEGIFLEDKTVDI
jgi:hypothetical protein